MCIFVFFFNSRQHIHSILILINVLFFCCCIESQRIRGRFVQSGINRESMFNFSFHHFLIYLNCSIIARSIYSSFSLAQKFSANWLSTKIDEKFNHNFVNNQTELNCMNMLVNQNTWYSIIICQFCLRFAYLLMIFTKLITIKWMIVRSTKWWTTYRVWKEKKGNVTAVVREYWYIFIY